MRKLSHTRKPSRGEAFAMLLKMEPSRDVDSLLNYFAPSAPKTPRDSFEYCAKAVADHHDVRAYLRYVYVEGGDIVATDGHRMHYGTTDLTDGFYDPKTRLPVDVSHKYPEWRRIVPKREGMSVGPHDIGSEVHRSGSTPVFATCLGGANINNVYIAQAGADTGRIYVDMHRNLVAGDTGHGAYVIQGIRL